MAKAIRPLAPQETEKVLSMLSNLGFHQSKITDKQIEFSGDNLPTIICTIREQKKSLLSAVLFVLTLSLTSKEII